MLRFLWTCAVFTVGMSQSAATQTPRVQVSSQVPFTIEESLGNTRIVIGARFNGHAMPMMVHSNAGLFAQLRHREGASFGVKLVPGTHQHYGIDRIGHVSDLGADRGVVRSLMVGRTENRQAPVNVFEVPQSEYGMLGLGWIGADSVVVDFSRHQLMTAPSIAQTRAMRARLLKQGYVAIPMAVTKDDGTYTVPVTISGNTRSMVVSVSSTTIIDRTFAQAASLKRGEDDGHGGGPLGAHTPNYRLADPVRVIIGGWMAPPITHGIIQDVYEYESKARPRNQRDQDGGALGTAFLQAAGAIVDFGNRTLFVRR